MLAAIAVFSLSAQGALFTCNDECLADTVRSHCKQVPIQTKELSDAAIAPLFDSGSLNTKIMNLKGITQLCERMTRACVACKNDTAFRGEKAEMDRLESERAEAEKKLKFAQAQLCAKDDKCKKDSDVKPAAAKPDGEGINNPSATYGDEHGGTDVGGTETVGTESGTGSGSGNRAADSSSSKKSSGMESVMPLMQMAMQMMAQKQQEQQQQQASCSGPNPAPGCPPQHICFTNPSSLECKCGPYGPGGPECGRPQLAATERNMGSPREKELVPPPPSEMSADEMNQAPDFKPSTSTPTSKGGGGGGGVGSMGNNSTPATTPKKKFAGGGSGSKDLGGARGFMGASPYKSSGPSVAKAAAEEKRKREDPRYDPTLQGAQLHYGRMLQAGMSNFPHIVPPNFLNTVPLDFHDCVPVDFLDVVPRYLES